MRNATRRFAARCNDRIGGNNLGNFHVLIIRPSSILAFVRTVDISSRALDLVRVEKEMEATAEGTNVSPQCVGGAAR